MRVCRVEIKNILGLEELEFEPGKITVIAGANASGKSSALEAIKAAIGGGHDASLLRQGADRGEIVLVLDDGTEIRKTVTSEASDLKVTHPQFGRISKGQTYLAKLADALSVNPLEFLTASDKERVAALLEAIPMRVTDEQLEAVVPERLRPLVSGIGTDGHALQVIGAVSKELFTQRTGVNRAAKEKRATANQMRETLPEAPESGDWSQEFERLRQEYVELQRTTAERVEAIKTEAQAALEQVAANEYELEFRVTGQESAAVSQLKKDAQAKIDAIREELERQLKLVFDDFGGQVKSVKEQAEKEREEIRLRREELLEAAQADYQPRNDELTESLSRAKTMLEQEARAQSTLEFIGKLDGEVETLEQTAGLITEALGGLEALKEQLLGELPVKGLEIRDGKILLGGIPFDRLNTAKQVQLAVEVAKLRARDLGIVCCDNLEHLDTNTFAAFVRAAQKSKLQFVVTRVVDKGPLAIAEAAAEEVA